MTKRGDASGLGWQGCWDRAYLAPGVTPWYQDMGTAPQEDQNARRPG